MTELLAVLVGVPLVIAGIAFITIPFIALNGYIIATLWGWFVVPTFNLAALTIPQAVGLSILVSYMKTAKALDTKDKTKQEKINALATAIANPILTLLMGYIVHKYFMGV